MGKLGQGQKCLWGQLLSEKMVLNVNTPLECYFAVYSVEESVYTRAHTHTHTHARGCYKSVSGFINFVPAFSTGGVHS